MQMKQIIKINITLFMIMVISVPSISYGGIDALRKSIFPKGTMSNNSKSAIVREQEANHLIGGSIVMRSPSDPGKQLLHVQPPSCKVGGLPCGAQFELFKGGLSVISGKELVEHLKELPKKAAAYGAIMAIKTLSSFTEDIMEYLDSKADWINQMAKTDCQDMEKMIGGMFTKQTAGSRATRQSAMFLGGEGKDMSDITNKSKKDDGEDSTKDKEELKSQLGDNYNLVWKALEEAGIKANTDGGAGTDDGSFRELLMSISGTVIGTKDKEGKYLVKHKKSLVDGDLIKEFAGLSSGEGSEVTLYKCDESKKCLDPKVLVQKLSKDGILFDTVSKLLLSITEKVKKDEGPFTAEEESLIALSSLQIVPKIEMDLATYMNASDVVTAQTEFIEALCLDVTSEYLIKLLGKSEEVVRELSYSQIADSGAFKDFEKETYKALKAINMAKHDAFKKYDLIAVTKARLQQQQEYNRQKMEEKFINQR